MAAVMCALLIFPVDSWPQQATMQQQATSHPTKTSQTSEQVPDSGQNMPGKLPEQDVALQSHPVSKVIPPDERYMLVLDRFTYGPRPGDLQRMRELGLSGWFQQQMNPARIDDSALDARLASYPAMNLPLEKLMELYPSRDMVKQSLNGKIGVPHGAAAKAIYADQQARYKEEQKVKKDGDKGDSVPEKPALRLSPAEMLALPPEKRFKVLCKLSLPQLGELRKEMTPDQKTALVADLTPQQREALAAFNGPEGVVAAEDVQVKLLRDVYTERQLQEVMVDFWLNHFNVYIKKSQQAPYYIAAYERESIRPYALGRFEDLLLSTATSPAMLNYLDNSESIGPHSVYATGFTEGPDFKGRGVHVSPPHPGVGLNENYAREVMELHTVGVNGGYTQRDVTELAKVFTGWTVGHPGFNDVPSQAEFDPTKHEPGPKTVMGVTIKENGEHEGIEALKMLAGTSQCARFISTKLAVRFVSDTPPHAIVDRMTQTFLTTHGDIRQVLLAMVNSPEFFTAATYRMKLKTPQEFVISAVRAAGAQVESTAGMQAAIADLGMPVYGMLTPNGYSMKAEAWNSTSQLVNRMNFAMALATNRVAGLKADPDSLLGADAKGLTPEVKAEHLEATLLHDPVSQKTQGLILGQLKIDAKRQASELQQVSTIRNGGDPLRFGGTNAPSGGKVAVDTQAELGMGLILGSPEFQRK
jgi:uncharacterized protein (DUF1800 family)